MMKPRIKLISILVTLSLLLFLTSQQQQFSYYSSSFSVNAQTSPSPAESTYYSYTCNNNVISAVLGGGNTDLSQSLGVENATIVFDSIANCDNIEISNQNVWYIHFLSDITDVANQIKISKITCRSLISFCVIFAGKISSVQNLIIDDVSLVVENPTPNEANENIYLVSFQSDIENIRNQVSLTNIEIRLGALEQDQKSLELGLVSFYKKFNCNCQNFLFQENSIVLEKGNHKITGLMKEFNAVLMIFGDQVTGVNKKFEISHNTIKTTAANGLTSDHILEVNDNILVGIVQFPHHIQSISNFFIGKNTIHLGTVKKTRDDSTASLARAINLFVCNIDANSFADATVSNIENFIFEENKIDVSKNLYCGSRQVSVLVLALVKPKAAGMNTKKFDMFAITTMLLAKNQVFFRGSIENKRDSFVANLFNFGYSVQNVTTMKFQENALNLLTHLASTTNENLNKISVGTYFQVAMFHFSHNSYPQGTGTTMDYWSSIKNIFIDKNNITTTGNLLSAHTRIFFRLFISKYSFIAPRASFRVTDSNIFIFTKKIKLNIQEFGAHLILFVSGLEVREMLISNCNMFISQEIPPRQQQQNSNNNNNENSRFIILPPLSEALSQTGPSGQIIVGETPTTTSQQTTFESIIVYVAGTDPTTEAFANCENFQLVNSNLVISSVSATLITTSLVAVRSIFANVTNFLMENNLLIVAGSFTTTYKAADSFDGHITIAVTRSYFGFVSNKNDHHEISSKLFFYDWKNCSILIFGSVQGEYQAGTNLQILMIRFPTQSSTPPSLTLINIPGGSFHLFNCTINVPNFSTKGLEVQVQIALFSEHWLLFRRLILLFCHINVKQFWSTQGSIITGFLHTHRGNISFFECISVRHCSLTSFQNSEKFDNFSNPTTTSSSSSSLSFRAEVPNDNKKYGAEIEIRGVLLSTRDKMSDLKTAGYGISNWIPPSASSSIFFYPFELLESEFVFDGMEKENNNYNNPKLIFENISIIIAGNMKIVSYKDRQTNNVNIQLYYNGGVPLVSSPKLFVDKTFQEVLEKQQQQNTNKNKLLLSVILRNNIIKLRSVQSEAHVSAVIFQPTTFHRKLQTILIENCHIESLSVGSQISSEVGAVRVAIHDTGSPFSDIENFIVRSSSLKLNSVVGKNGYVWCFTMLLRYPNADIDPLAYEENFVHDVSFLKVEDTSIFVRDAEARIDAGKRSSDIVICHIYSHGTPITNFSLIYVVNSSIEIEKALTRGDGRIATIYLSNESSNISKFFVENCDLTIGAGGFSSSTGPDVRQALPLYFNKQAANAYFGHLIFADAQNIVIDIPFMNVYEQFLVSGSVNNVSNVIVRGSNVKILGKIVTDPMQVDISLIHFGSRVVNLGNVFVGDSNLLVFGNVSAIGNEPEPHLICAPAVRVSAIIFAFLKRRFEVRGNLKLKNIKIAVFSAEATRGYVVISGLLIRPLDWMDAVIDTFGGSGGDNNNNDLLTTFVPTFRSIFLNNISIFSDSVKSSDFFIGSSVSVLYFSTPFRVIRSPFDAFGSEEEESKLFELPAAALTTTSSETSTTSTTATTTTTTTMMNLTQNNFSFPPSTTTTTSPNLIPEKIIFNISSQPPILITDSTISSSYLSPDDVKQQKLVNNNDNNDGNRCEKFRCSFIRMNLTSFPSDYGQIDSLLAREFNFQLFRNKIASTTRASVISTLNEQNFPKNSNTSFLLDHFKLKEGSAIFSQIFDAKNKFLLVPVLLSGEEEEEAAIAAKTTSFNNNNEQERRRAQISASSSDLTKKRIYDYEQLPINFRKTIFDFKCTNSWYRNAIEDFKKISISQKKNNNNNNNQEQEEKETSSSSLFSRTARINFPCTLSQTASLEQSLTKSHPSMSQSISPTYHVVYPYYSPLRKSATAVSNVASLFSLTAASNSVGAARTQRTLKLLGQIADGECGAEAEDEPQDIASSPLQLNLGKSGGGYTGGVVVGNVLFLLFMVFFVFVGGYCCWWWCEHRFSVSNNNNQHHQTNEKKKSKKNSTSSSSSTKNQNNNKLTPFPSFKQFFVNSKAGSVAVLFGIILFEPIVSSTVVIAFSSWSSIPAKIICLLVCIAVLTSITLIIYFLLFQRKIIEEFVIKKEQQQQQNTDEKEEEEEEELNNNNARATNNSSRSKLNNNNQNLRNSKNKNQQQKSNKHKSVEINCSVVLKSLKYIFFCLLGEEGEWKPKRNEEGKEKEKEKSLSSSSAAASSSTKKKNEKSSSKLGENKNKNLNFSPQDKLLFELSLPLLEGYTSRPILASGVCWFFIADILVLFCFSVATISGAVSQKVGASPRAACLTNGIITIVDLFAHTLLTIIYRPNTENFLKIAIPILGVLQISALVSVLVGVTEDTLGDLVIVLASLQLVVAISTGVAFFIPWILEVLEKRELEKQKRRILLLEQVDAENNNYHNNNNFENDDEDALLMLGVVDSKNRNSMTKQQQQQQQQKYNNNLSNNSRGNSRRNVIQRDPTNNPNNLLETLRSPYRASFSEYQQSGVTTPSASTTNNNKQHKNFEFSVFSSSNSSSSYHPPTTSTAAAASSSSSSSSLKPSQTLQSMLGRDEILKKFHDIRADKMKNNDKNKSTNNRNNNGDDEEEEIEMTERTARRHSQYSPSRSRNDQQHYSRKSPSSRDHHHHHHQDNYRHSPTSSSSSPSSSRRYNNDGYYYQDNDGDDYYNYNQKKNSSSSSRNRRR